MNPRQSLSGPFGLSLAALGLVALFLLFTLPSLLGAVFKAGTGSAKPAETVDRLLAKHDEGMKTYQSRFNGRSPFFKPPPKYTPPPPPPPIVKDNEPPPPPPPPTIPTVYGGPSLVAIFGGEAWFKAPAAGDKPFTLKIGQTEPKSGVKLLSTDPPWSIRVAHKGGEYTVGFNVPMFDPNKTDPYFKVSPKMSLPIPGLNIMPVPIAAAPETGSTTGTSTEGDSSGEDGGATKPDAPPGQLQAKPLDGTGESPVAERDTQKAREATGESDDEDEEPPPAQSQPAPARRPVASPSDNAAVSGTASGGSRPSPPPAPK